MKRILSVFLLLCALVPLRAQDADALKRSIMESGNRITGITCHFVQTKRSAMLAEEAVSSGKMVFRSPDYLQWSYEKPSARTFVYDGSAPQGGKDKVFGDLARLIVSSITGGNLSDGTAFRTEAVRDGGDILVTLYPLKRDLKRLFTSLVLRYKADTLDVTCFEMNEASGDRTVITFTGSKVTRK